MKKRLVPLVVSLLLLLGLAEPCFATYLPESFGGNGSDGSATISSNTTETATLNKNYINYTLNSSTTHTVKSGTIFKAIGTVTVNGTLAVSADIPGGLSTSTGTYTQGGAGSGPSGGFGGQESGWAGGDNTNVTGAGGGGGCGGAGTTANGAAFSGGGPGGGAMQPNRGLTGSGGGSSHDAAGGNGGGSINVFANGQITVASTGSITANGTAGANQAGTPTTGGGGGGSGGVIGLYSQTGVAIAGTVQAKGALGGNGGTANTNGGKGGGGWIIRMSPNNTGAGTLDVAAVSGGNAGQTLSITGTPSHPTMTSHRKHRGIMIELAGAQSAVRGIDDVRISHRDNASFMASLEPEKDFASNMCELQYGEPSSSVVLSDFAEGGV